MKNINEVSMIGMRRRQPTVVKDLNDMPTLTPIRSSQGYFNHCFSNQANPYHQTISDYPTPRETISYQHGGRNAASMTSSNSYHYLPMQYHYQSAKAKTPVQPIPMSPPYYLQQQNGNRNNPPYLNTNMTSAQYMQMLNRYNYNNIRRQQQQLQAQYEAYLNQQMYQQMSPSYYDYSYYYSTAESIFKTQCSVGELEVQKDLQAYTNNNSMPSNKSQGGYEAIQVDNVTRDTILNDFKKEAQDRKRKIRECIAATTAKNKKNLKLNLFSVSENSAFVPASPVVQQPPPTKRLKHYDENNNTAFNFPETLYNMQNGMKSGNNDTHSVIDPCGDDYPAVVIDVEETTDGSFEAIPQESKKEAPEDDTEKSTFSELLKDSIVI